MIRQIFLGGTALGANRPPLPSKSGSAQKTVREQRCLQLSPLPYRAKMCPYPAVVQIIHKPHFPSREKFFLSVPWEETQYLITLEIVGGLQQMVNCHGSSQYKDSGQQSAAAPYTLLKSVGIEGLFVMCAPACLPLFLSRDAY